MLVLAPLALLVFLGLSVGVGFALGQRWHRQDTSGDHGQLGVIEGAILGLLALVLGFTFSGAMGRFTDRQRLLVQEANAIGTLDLRAALLPEAERDALRGALREYTAARLELWSAVEEQHEVGINRRLAELQQRLFHAALQGVHANPQTQLSVLPPTNEIIDLLGERNAAARRHTPAAVLAVLLACAGAAVAAVGYGLAITRRGPWLPAGVLVFLIACTIWITIDLDYPRVGLIRTDPTPLLDVQRQLTP